MLCETEILTKRSNFYFQDCRGTTEQAVICGTYVAGVLGLLPPKIVVSFHEGPVSEELVQLWWARPLEEEPSRFWWTNTLVHGELYQDLMGLKDSVVWDWPILLGATLQPLSDLLKDSGIQHGQTVYVHITEHQP